MLYFFNFFKYFSLQPKAKYQDWFFFYPLQKTTDKKKHCRRTPEVLMGGFGASVTSAADTNESVEAMLMLSLRQASSNSSLDKMSATV